MMPCLNDECVGAAEEDGDLFALDAYTVDGVSQVWYQRYTCTSGCRYMVEVYHDNPELPPWDPENHALSE